MKKLILITISFFIMSTVSQSDMTDGDKSKTIECTGIYYANSMIPQGELELEKIVHSFAAKKFLSSYLIKKGVEEEKLNKKTIKIVDIRYGKAYEEDTTKECDNFIFKLIPGSKDEIKKIAESGIY
ncbi:MAG: hypothetical protein EVA75_00120 [Candidatus Pelagibacterales bacterium]|nr:MAG: hypothetical protein EVA75_00120 [Pelagibacterales bacterium]|tara:strand:- start:420 stop:797 length:378 start_codon:yes stop_codon:yes gene_type:complete